MFIPWLLRLLQDYIARFGHGSAKLARQAQSKEKTLKKMTEGGLAEKVVSDKVGLSTCTVFSLISAPGRLIIGMRGH